MYAYIGTLFVPFNLELWLQSCIFSNTRVCFGTFYARRLRFGAGPGASFAAAAAALSILDPTCFM